MNLNQKSKLIRNLTGCFRDRKLEHEYRAYSFKRERIPAFFLILMINIVSASLIYNDYLLFFSDKTLFYRLIFLRFILLAISILVLYIIKTSEKFIVVDLTLAFWFVVIFIIGESINYTRPLTFSHISILRFIILFMLYTWLPIRFIFQIALAFIYSLTMLYINFCVSTNNFHGVESAFLIISLVGVNIYGFYLTNQIHKIKRNEYYNWKMAKLAEEKERDTNFRLRHALSELETIFNNNAVGLIYLKDGKVVNQVNKRGLMITGYSREELINRDPDFLYQNYDEKMQKMIHDELLKYASIETEMIIKRKNAKLIHCKFFGSIIEPGRIDSGIIWAFTDISRQKKLEEFKETIDRISRHDLKNPLSAIVGFSTIIMDNNEDLEAEDKEALQFIRDSAFEMLEQIDNSLNLYKIENGTYFPRLETIDFIDLLRRLLHRHFLLSQEMRGIAYQVTLNGRSLRQDDYLLIETDKNLLLPLLGNLIKNAIEASHKNDTVFIEINTLTKKNIEIRVINNGEIPIQIQSTFFNKFSTYGKSGGSGLGTYSAKLMTDTLGGEISFSTGFGKTILLVRLKTEPVQQEL
ncbi:MAG: PAS domain S-box protein [Leptospiraceae bacterium]|nr:PAS domain S-box protein [Leptospiraceae bacterium]